MMETMCTQVLQNANEGTTKSDLFQKDFFGGRSEECDLEELSEIQFKDTCLV